MAKLLQDVNLNVSKDSLVLCFSECGDTTTAGEEVILGVLCHTQAFCAPLSSQIPSQAFCPMRKSK